MIDKITISMVGTIFLNIMLDSVTPEIWEHNNVVGDTGDIVLPIPDIICIDVNVELNWFIDTILNFDIIDVIVIKETVPEPSKVQNNTIANNNTDDKIIGFIEPKDIWL